jgi:hypothetical protein
MVVGDSHWRVLVLGGHGLFGRHLVERLAADEGLEVVVAGRSLQRSEALCDRLAATARARLRAVALDIDAPSFEQEMGALAPQAVVHTAGPFTGTDYRVARACIAVRAHGIDLADDRRFVAGIAALDADARAAGVLVASGASSVPALSAAVVDQFARGLTRVDHIRIGISPGHRSGRGLATVRSVLARCGTPIVHADGAHEITWGNLQRHTFGAPVGVRLLSPLEVPDLDLLPRRYPGQPAVRFGAGLELWPMHLALLAMAVVRRVLGVPDWAGLARPLHRIAAWSDTLGSDAGAMHVQVDGVCADGRAVRRGWELIATHGHGPHVPTLAASALLRRLRGDAPPPVGAMPCVGLLDLADIAGEARGLRVSMHEIGPA